MLFSVNKKSFFLNSQFCFCDNLESNQNRIFLSCQLVQNAAQYILQLRKHPSTMNTKCFRIRKALKNEKRAKQASPLLRKPVKLLKQLKFQKRNIIYKRVLDDSQKVSARRPEVKEFSRLQIEHPREFAKLCILFSHKMCMFQG